MGQQHLSKICHVAQLQFDRWVWIICVLSRSAGKIRTCILLKCGLVAELLDSQERCFGTSVKMSLRLVMLFAVYSANSGVSWLSRFIIKCGGSI